MVAELIRELKENNINVSLRDGELKLKFNDEKVAGRYIERVREKKKEIIEYLASLEQYHDEVAIKQVLQQDSYVLSSAQRRLWVLSQVGNGNVAYNMPGAFLLEGSVVKAAFNFAFNEIIKRHESLRTVFRGDNEIVQIVLPVNAVLFSVGYTDLSQEQDALREQVLAESLQPFDLYNGPLLRAHLWRLSATRSVLTYTMHHIISDGWSMDNINKELRLFYNAYVDREPVQLPALEIQYKDYAVWQQESLRSPDVIKHRTYWLQRFSDEIPVLNLPVDFPRPAIKANNGGKVYSAIDPALTTLLREFCKQQQATLFMGLMSAVSSLLYRYTDQSNIIIGTPVAGRDNQQLDNQIGVYLNTLALRIDINAAGSFTELMAKVKQEALNAFDHQSYPFDELVDQLQLNRDISRSALFDVMVALLNTKNRADSSNRQLSGLQLSEYREHTLVTSKFDLTFDFEEIEESIELRIEYNSDLFKHSTVERMANHFAGLLKAALNNPSKAVGRLEYMSEEERALLLNNRNNLQVTYPAAESIVSLFEKQADLTPHKIAWVFEGRTQTYQLLNEAANRLAHYLVEQLGVQQEDKVAIMLPRSANVLVAIMGILKAGGCYVPIDPEYPQERKEYMLQDSGSVVVIDEAFMERYEGESVKYSSTNPGTTITPTQLAYVIYTSGTTGQPKGVMVEHTSVVRLVKSTDYVSITESDRVMSLSSFSFDGSVFDVFGALLNGARIVLVDKASIVDCEAIGSIIRSEQVSVSFITTALFNVLTDTGLKGIESLKYVLFGGERVSEQHVQQFRKQFSEVKLVHVYGPTENTTFSLSYAVTGDDYSVIPIGKAINGSTAYILSGEQQLCPLGVEGEIYVGGAGVARGYLNAEELTATKFITNPYRPGERLYRTGDIGRWLEGGIIEFRGRRDDQVKIRGFRVELGEIEYWIERFEGISKAVVMVREESGAADKQLVAYITARGEVDKAALKKFMNSSLPAYLMPAYIIQLEEFPLNKNGKIDKRQLPWQNELFAGHASSMLNAPRNEIEEKLMTIWKDLLGKEHIGVTDNLFELGGHSLKVAKLANQLHKDFNVKLNIQDLFATAVLEDQAALIKKSLQQSYKPIPPVSWQSAYPLSSSQKRLWVLSQTREGSVAYNMPGVYTLNGNLDIAAFEHAFFALIDRHESLRTVFREDDNREIKQFILSAEEAAFSICQVDLVNSINAGQEIRKYIDEDYTRHFSLENGPMLYAALYKVSADQWIFSCVMHHIISDGWSMGILIRELFLLYNTQVTGGDNPLKPLRVQYKDYAVWQQNELSSNAFEEAKNYWLNQLATPLPVLLLPADRPRPAIRSYKGGTIYKEIGEPAFSQLQQLNTGLGTTLFMSLLAAVNILLHRYTEQDDIIIGSPVAGRDHVDLEDQIGFFINTLAFRSRVSGQDCFTSILEQVKKATIDAYKYQSLPFDEIINALDIQADPSRNMLFDVMVVLQEKKNIDITDKELSGVSVSGYWDGKDSETVSKLDLTFEFDERADRLGLRIVYNADIYKRPTVDRMAEHFIALLGALLNNPDEAIGRIGYVSEEERVLLLNNRNNLQVTYPAEESIVSLFERQADLTPYNIAWVFEGRTQTYQLLNEAANCLSHYLVEQLGVQQEDKVAIMLSRSANVLVAIMGILKAGGCYVPIDPEYPQERKEYMLRDSGSVVVIDEAFMERYEGESLKYSSTNPGITITPTQLAYVIYTSGTTGQPKGVMVEHTSVVRLVKSTDYVSITDNDRIMSLSSFSFDGSVFDVFGALLNGARIVLVDKASIVDCEAIGSIISSEQVSVFFITTALFNVLTDTGLKGIESLKYVLFGGERVSEQHVQQFRKQFNEVKLVHVYGPTENTTFSLSYAVTGDDYSVIPIGKAINGSTAYILSGEQQLCPLGVEGEIYVGGAGVARGYLNAEELTATKFITNPYRPGERLYRTGDIGRWLEGGIIEFRGRRDDQVKIRGFRVELGEIEYWIERFAGIKKSVVIARQNSDGEKELSAYVEGAGTVDLLKLREYLSASLPAYMVPIHIMALPSFPLNKNGKIDKKMLPEMAGIGGTAAVGYVAPRNAIEAQLVKLWEEILQQSGIGVKDNFFELGGHSLKVTRLMSRIYKVFDVKLSLKDIMLRPVLEAQAALIESSTKNRFQEIAQAPQSRSYPMSSSQRRLWMLSQLQDGSVAYNVPGAYVFTGAVDKAGLTNAFICLLERHEILRTVFREDEQGEVRQYILPTTELAFTIGEEDISNGPDAWEAVRLHIQEDFIQAFDLSNGPLLRATLYKVEQGRWVFSCVMYHIISDGWSMGILVKELQQFYDAYLQGQQATLEPLRIQYKDYAVWQQQLLSGGSLQEHRNYWIEKLSGELPVLELPTDKVRPSVKTYEGAYIYKRISPSTSQRIKEIGREQDCSLFMSLLAAVNVLLYRYSDQPDIIVGSPVAGREHADLEDQLGFYVNTLTLRTKLAGEDSYVDLLQRTRTETIASYQHQAYPFDALIDELSLTRDLSRNPLFDVMVALQNNEAAVIGSGVANSLNAQDYTAAAYVKSQFDLVFNFLETAEGINIAFNYNTDIYKESTAERMVAHFISLLEALSAKPGEAIARLLYISAEEQALLTNWSRAKVDYPAAESIVSLFEKQADLTPHKIAWVFEGRTQTYQLLNEAANRLAHYLVEQLGVQQEDKVAIMLPRSANVLVAIMGILKAGGCYVPIDPEYPQERKEYMLQDSGSVVVIDEAFMERYEGESVKYSNTNPGIAIAPQQLAYVIYTSGTTGQPKGVMVEHTSVVRLVKSPNYVSITENDRIMSLSSFSFDGSVFDVFGALLNGARIVLVDKASIVDCEAIGSIIRSEQVSVFFITTALFNVLTDTGLKGVDSLKYVLFGGERVSEQHVQQFREQFSEVKLMHVYGPTENTTFSLSYAITGDDYSVIPIGKAINGSTAYILSGEQQLCPLGVEGEIYVGGAGVARGYLNAEELTATKFIVNPYMPGERLYRTGDIGRWLEGGIIEFRGRRDDQVKIRGFRVELGEIEYWIERFAGIKKSVVMARQNNYGEKELAAYVEADGAIDLLQLRSYLTGILPAYMVPAHMMALPSFPLNKNGKIDKRNLPEITGTDTLVADSYLAPRNTIEEQLVKLWEEILQQSGIGVKDNFFELGGHSLKVTRLMSRIYKVFDVKLGLKDIMLRPVLEAQAALIESSAKSRFLQIALAPQSDSYPMSSSQRRLWMLSQLEEGNVAYNIPGAYVFEGIVDEAGLNHAFLRLLERHEILRTVFKENEQGEVRQYILSLNELSFTIGEEDISNEPDVWEVVRQHIQEDFVQSFELSNGPLLRATLYKVEQERWVFSCVMHHIISDGWSMGILVKELQHFYNAYLQGEHVALEPLRIQYKDYAVWQQQLLSGGSLQEHRHYWVEKLSGELPVLELPTDKARPSVKTYQGAYIYKTISQETGACLNALSRKQDCSLFMSLLAAVNVLLYRYSDQSDIIVGSPVAGREHTDLDDQLGFYVNTLTLRTKLASEDSYLDLLQRTRTETIASYQHQAYPFDALINDLSLARDMSRNPLFDVMVALQNNEAAVIGSGGTKSLNVQDYTAAAYVKSQFDLVFNFQETAAGINMALNYNTDLYKEATAERMASHFIALLEALVSNPGKAIGRLEYVSEAEYALLLNKNNRSQVAYPREETIVSLFEKQVALTPDNIAWLSEAGTQTYQLLNASANRLAHYLVEQLSVQREDMVAVMLPRSANVLVAILGVLKAGCCYVPIDPDYPQERKEYMLQDSGSVVVLDETFMERYETEAVKYSNGNPGITIAPQQLAYVIYTSGTTGQPKGVMVEHRNVVRLFMTAAPLFDFNEKDVWVLFHSYCFDFSVWEMYGALLYGGKLIIAPKIITQDGIAFFDLLLKEEVTVLNQTPSAFYNLAKIATERERQNLSLRYVIFGGEALSPGRLKEWAALYPEVALINMYGITETTVHVTYKRISEQEIENNNSSIGHPIPTLYCYVLDKYQQLTPIGIPGELYVGGAGLARGYLNKPELTATRFIDDPFIPGNRLYYSGDVALISDEGELQYRGRSDDQVKIRGFRVELGEIEYWIERFAGIKKSVVIARQSSYGEKELVAYIEGAGTVDWIKLREHLADVLPAYMVPAHMIELPSFPLNSNGKIDKKKLPEVTGMGEGATVEYVTPRNATERQLAKIWQDILEQSGFGVKDNFFELGGHSLKATRLMSRIHKVFDVKLGLRDIMFSPVLEAQALLIESSAKSRFRQIAQAPQSDSYPMSSSQRRLWMLSQLEEGNIAYNIPGAYVFEGVVDEAGLNDAFRRLLERHEILRTVFREDEQGEVRQYILPLNELSFIIGYEDISHKPDAWGAVSQLIQEDFIQSFELSRGPLLRATLYQVEQERWVFSCVMHHIISDGWSMGILIKELQQFYNEYLQGQQTVVVPLRIQYKDYAVWQQQLLSGGSLQEHRHYWMEKLSGELPVLELPTDKVRPSIKTYQGSYIYKTISRETGARLNALSREQDCSLFMSLLAAVNVLLYRYSDQDDIIVGSPVAGREHTDLEDQLGFYINTLTLRTKLTGDDSYTALLKRTRTETIASYQHQAYPFDALIEDLSLKRDISRNPLFDVMVVLQNNELAGLNNADGLGKMTVRDYTEAQYVRSRFDLVFNFHETADGINIALGYNTDIYHELTADRIAVHFIGLLESLIANPGEAIARLPYLPAEERVLLHNWGRAQVDYPATEGIISLFQKQVDATPLHIALVYEDCELTYQELNERSNQLAAYLVKQGIGEGELICLSTRRSAEVIVGILGILKAGAAYVPVDPGYPADRIAFIVKDTACKVFIAENKIRDKIGTLVNDIQVIDLQQDRFIFEEREAFVPIVRKPEALFYVIYTSGSTGMPKGVLVEERSMTDHVYGLIQEAGLSTCASFALFATLAADAGHAIIFSSLLLGKTLHVLSDDLLEDGEQVCRYLADHAIDCLKIVPSLWLSYAVDTKAPLVDKVMIFGGEAFNKSVIDILLNAGSKAVVYNHYGPTEVTIGKCIHKVDLENVYETTVPIGKPFSNAYAYILNEFDQLAPVGIPGELCIGGVGVARGYLNRPDLTAEKFVADPYQPGGRMYRTGDKARWLADGNIEYLGRKDEQVKIRGYRIELGEIEHALLKIEGISGAAVTVCTGITGDPELAAYVTGTARLEAKAFRRMLNEQLPGYMVPVHYVKLEAIPLTNSGKVNRKLLPAPDFALLNDISDYVAPGNEKEKVLIDVMQAVLKQQSIGMLSDFFLLGGDSIKAIQVVSRLKQRGYRITIQNLLLHPELRDMSGYLQQGADRAVATTQNATIPLGSIQRRFFTLNGDPRHYNQSILLEHPGRTQREVIEKIMAIITTEHDLLRAIYQLNENTGEWTQHITPVSEFRLEILEEDADPDTATYERLCDALQTGMQLNKGPLFKITLVHSGDKDLLLLVAHHLVVDAVSWRIIVDDINWLYNQYRLGETLELPGKTDSWQYWQNQLNKWAANLQNRHEQTYWDHIDNSSTDHIPKDYPAGSNRVKDIETVAFDLDPADTTTLQTACYRAYRTGMNDILMYCLGKALFEKWGIRKIRITMEGQGRETPEGMEEIDIARTVGWFTSLFPVLLETDEQLEEVQQLIRVKEVLHRIPNKGIGYGLLKSRTGFDSLQQEEIVFNYLGNVGGATTLDNDNLTPDLFKYSGHSRGNDIAPERENSSVLSVSAIVFNGRFRLVIRYSGQQFRKDTIEALIQSFQANLLSLLARLPLEAQCLTPVDLTWKGVSITTLNELNRYCQVEDIYPLNPMQEGMYYHWLRALDPHSYVVQNNYRMHGHLDGTLIERSYQWLVDRHAVLRTHFIHTNTTRPVQVVTKNINGAFLYEDVRSKPAFSLSAYREQERTKGFELNRGSQMRLTVLRLGEQEYEFIWSYHHILMDGWCIGVLVREFYQTYLQLQKRAKPLQSVAPLYSDYFKWYNTIDQDASLDYWKQYLAGYSDLTGFPKQPGSKEASGQKKKCILELGNQLSNQIRETCQRLGVTENTFLQVIWALLLGRYNNKEDVVFGVVVSGRPAEVPHIEEMIGLFINTIPVRVNSREATRFEQLVKAVQQQSIQGLNHHYVHLSDIQGVNILGSELFDHILVFENYPVLTVFDEQTTPGRDQQVQLNVSATEVFSESNYDLTLVVMPLSAGWKIEFMYNPAVYTSTQIQAATGHLLNLIREVTKDPKANLQELSLMTNHEQELLFSWMHGTGTPWLHDESIVSLFEKQVSLTPYNTALVYEGVAQSYDAMNKAANRLARYLQQKLVLKPEDRVAIMLPRSGMLLTAILGTLKAGGCYVPIDTDYPQERIEYMIKNSGSVEMIDEAFMELYAAHSLSYSDEDLPIEIAPNHLAYIMYTSGTTGQPKGVMITHRNVAGLIKETGEVQILSDDVLLCTGSPSFDATTWEYWGTLLNGSCLVMCSKQDLLDPKRLKDLIKRWGATIMWFTSEWLNELVETDISVFAGLRKIVSGGSRLSNWHIGKLLEKYSDTTIINGYGPTENTTFSLIHTISESDIKSNSIPIGKPFVNRSVYILDERGMLCPVGVEGELYVGGAGVALGYLNAPALTADKFIADPYRKGARLYRTGDMGRWLDSGIIEFRGRRDDQVKIRGYRVELGEIMSTLNQYPGVHTAVVRTAEKDPNELVAYLVSNENIAPDKVKDFLARQLPSYMVPNRIICLDKIPLTAHGKVDLKQLDSLYNVSTVTAPGKELPANEQEEELVKIWQELLNRDEISVTDSFFDVGGNSIKIIRLTSLIKSRLGIEVEVSTLFQYPTIKQLVAFINNQLPTHSKEVPDESDLPDFDLFKID